MQPETHTTGKVPLPDHTDDLRRLLNGETYDSTPSQWRLEDLYEWWELTDAPRHDLDHALLQLVENGEVSLFPVGNVVKIQLE